MKFDVIIGNPPYTRCVKDTRPLYIEILSNVIDNAYQVIWLCPSQWVLGYNIKNSIINDFKLNHKMYDYIHIENPFSDATMANVVGIYHFNYDYNQISYDDIFYSKFRIPSIVKSIEHKFKSYKTHLNDFNNKEDKNKLYYVNAALIRGHICQKTGEKQWDWTTLFGEKQRTIFNRKLKDREVFWKFNTEDECKNFVKTHENEILEFAQLIEKTNTNIRLNLTPYLIDYTHEWSNKMIAEELQLTNDELKYIHEEMKEYGWKAKK